MNETITIVKKWFKHTHETYIKLANELHNNYYDYSLTKYSGKRKIIEIICPVHGKFTQEAGQHITINLQTNKPYGCRKCGTDQRNRRMIEESEK